MVLLDSYMAVTWQVHARYVAVMWCYMAVMWQLHGVTWHLYVMRMLQLGMRLSLSIAWVAMLHHPSGTKNRQCKHADLFSLQHQVTRVSLTLTLNTSSSLRRYSAVICGGSSSLALGSPSACEAVPH